MRVLLDENLDWRLRRELPGQIVESVPLLGWAGLKNSELVRAEGKFDVLITMDASLSFQRNIAKHQITLVVLKAPSNGLRDTRPLMSKVLSLLSTLQPGIFTVVSA